MLNKKFYLTVINDYESELEYALFKTRDEAIKFLVDCVKDDHLNIESDLTGYERDIYVAHTLVENNHYRDEHSETDYDIQEIDLNTYYSNK